MTRKLQINYKDNKHLESALLILILFSWYLRTICGVCKWFYLWATKIRFCTWMNLYCSAFILPPGGHRETSHRLNKRYKPAGRVTVLSYILIIYSSFQLRSRSPWTPVKTTIEINSPSLLHVLKPLQTRQTEVCQSTSRAPRNPVVLNFIYYRRMNLLSNKGQPKC